MNIRLLNGSEPVILDIEDNSYKPKLTITSSGVSISADLSSSDIDEIISALAGGTTISGLEEEVMHLSEDNSDLEAKVNELEGEIEVLKTENKELEETIKELEAKIKELRERE
jgi:peptidoglycan hydrolase CwlO-like protein